MTGAVVSGIGQSQVGRRLGRSPLSLTVDAALEAIADAGLTAADIDGVSTWPGAFAASPGFSGVGCWDIKDALGLSLNWFSGGIESSGQLGAVINACAAVTAGLASHVLCFRTVWESTAQTAGRRASVVGSGSDRIDGAQQWMVPFGAVSAANWSAMIAQRHFHEYGTTREQLGALAVSQRANAALNPKAVFREPITLGQYLAARMISDPLCLLDCDIPVDGSTAVVVSRADTAADLRAPLLRIAAHSSALGGRPYWDQHEDLTSMAGADAGRNLWQHTDLTVGDVDVAGIYDGFTILTVVWLEALGVCGRGEAGPFLEGGKRIARDGQFPLNTGGGQLSAGRLHGFGHLHEVCLQLRGEAGERQVPGGPEVGLVAAGGGELGGALLLTRAGCLRGRVPAGALRLGGFLRGGLPGPGALPERCELCGRCGQAEARGERRALPAGQPGIESEETVDAEPAQADRGQRDRGRAQVQHVLVAFAGDEEAVRDVDQARERPSWPEDLGVAGLIDAACGQRRADAGASAGTCLALAALNRLAAPCSKLRFAEWWATTAAPRFTKVPARVLDHRCFWDAMHAVTLERLEAAGQAVTLRAVQAFGLDCSSVALDMTNFATCIATQNKRAPIAQRGKAKQRRTSRTCAGCGDPRAPAVFAGGKRWDAAKLGISVGSTW